MILNDLRIVLVIIAGLGKPTQAAGRLQVVTAAPAHDLCLFCSNDASCQMYRTNSVCRTGQCTDENDLFGLGCNCQSDSECASGRCDGLFRMLCLAKVGNGEICNEDSDCQSGHCSILLVCEPAEEDSSSLATERQPNTIMDKSTTHSSNTSPETEAWDPTAQASGNKISKACTRCSDSSTCGAGSCIDGLCADASGAHPPTCVNCNRDEECIEGYFCYGSDLVLQNRKKCAAKRANGYSCNRNEGCISGHCNVLYRCESKAPEIDRNATESDYALQYKATETGLAIWYSISGALVLFGVCAMVFCQKDGAEEFFLSLTQKKKRGRVEATESDEFGDSEKEKGCQPDPTPDSELKEQV